MLEIYLPIAQVNIDIFLLLFLSLAVGVLSGLFGVGGGFLMTPFLIFMGIPPVYAVPNEVNNILATSVSGSLTHWYKKTLDYKMGLMIVSGGVVGTIIGIMTFTFFSQRKRSRLIFSMATNLPLNFSCNKFRKAGGKDVILSSILSGFFSWLETT